MHIIQQERSYVWSSWCQWTQEKKTKRTYEIPTTYAPFKLEAIIDKEVVHHKNLDLDGNIKLFPDH